MRLFVALEVPKETLEAISALVARLAPSCRGARWTRPEAIHLTLKFIGEVSTAASGHIRKELAAVRAPAPIEVRFRGAGFFPNPRQPRVLWTGVEAPLALAELAGEIERRLEPLGIPREEREFRPHLTLARFKSADGVAALRAALEAADSLEFGSACYHEFHMIESVLQRDGAKYRRLETFPFVAGGAAAGGTA